MRAVAPPPGFRGLDPDKRITIYTRHLPHWRQPGGVAGVGAALGETPVAGSWTTFSRAKMDDAACVCNDA